MRPPGLWDCSSPLTLSLLTVLSLVFFPRETPVKETAVLPWLISAS